MSASPDTAFWSGRRVLLTGHTGFKGAWLSFWLAEMGAEVIGYALAPDTEPALFDLLGLAERMEHHVGDVRDGVALGAALRSARPDVVMHLAAQPIVSEGYRTPAATFETNVMGTVHLLEACRGLGPVPVVVVSSDKCYRNDGSGRAFEVDDPLGGDDPYSASKAGTEIAVTAWRRSFLHDPDGPRLASARAGNVVGGGDWSVDRLLPDCARAFAAGRPARLRNPRATRPWQHVLEPLHGYMMLAETLARDPSMARAWNFGPGTKRGHRPVDEVATLFREAWSDVAGDAPQLLREGTPQDWHEAPTLDLDIASTQAELGWHPALSLEETVRWTATWYAEAMRPDGSASAEAARAATAAQIAAYAARRREPTDG